MVKELKGNIISVPQRRKSKEHRKTRLDIPLTRESVKKDLDNMLGKSSVVDMR